MPLGTEVGLGPGHVVSDGDPAPNGKGHSTPTFQPTLLWHGLPSQQLLVSLFLAYFFLIFTFRFSAIEETDYSIAFERTKTSPIVRIGITYPINNCCITPRSTAAYQCGYC